MKLNKIKIFSTLLFLVAAGSTAFFYWNDLHLKSIPLGILAFIIYSVISSYFLGIFLHKQFSLKKFFGFALAFLSIIFLLGFLSSFFINFSNFPTFYNGLVLLIITLVSFILFLINLKTHIEEQKEELPTRHMDIFGQISIGIFSLSTIISTIILFSVRTGGYFTIPWQIIPNFFFYLVIIATIILLILIFRSYSWKIIVTLIIVHSFLIHAMFPIIYQNGYGGDKWRHLANEKVVMNMENSTRLVALPELAKTREFGPFNVPTVLLTNTTSYGNLYGTVITLTRFTQIDIYYIDLILSFLLWSFFFPLIFFLIGEMLFKKRRFSYLLAFFPSSFYLLTVNGAATIPSGYGNIILLLTIFFWLKYIEKPTLAKKVFNLFFTVLQIFTYAVTFVYSVLIAMLGIILNSTKKQKLTVLAIIITILFVFLMPSLDLLFGVTHFEPEKTKSITTIIQTFWVFLRNNFYLSTDHIKIIIFSPNKDYWNNELLANTVELILTALMILGLIVAKKVVKDVRLTSALLVLLIVSWLNFFFNWYIMDPFGPLGRRVDISATIATLPFIIIGLVYLIQLIEKTKVLVKITETIVIIILIAIFVTGFTTGPSLNLLTEDQQKSVSVIMDFYAIHADQPPCIMSSDEWALLDLRYRSANKILDGGVTKPTSGFSAAKVKNHVVQAAPPVNIVDKAGVIYALNNTGASYCFYVIDTQKIPEIDKASKWDLNAYFKSLRTFASQETNIGSARLFLFSRKALIQPTLTKPIVQVKE